jgi:hypothetical protein
MQTDYTNNVLAVHSEEPQVVDSCLGKRSFCLNTHDGRDVCDGHKCDYICAKSKRMHGSFQSEANSGDMAEATALLMNFFRTVQKASPSLVHPYEATKTCPKESSCELQTIHCCSSHEHEQQRDEDGAKTNEDQYSVYEALTCLALAAETAETDADAHKPPDTHLGKASNDCESAIDVDTATNVHTETDQQDGMRRPYSSWAAALRNRRAPRKPRAQNPGERMLTHADIRTTHGIACVPQAQLCSRIHRTMLWAQPGETQFFTHDKQHHILQALMYDRFTVKSVAMWNILHIVHTHIAVAQSFNIISILSHSTCNCRDCQSYQ